MAAGVISRVIVARLARAEQQGDDLAVARFRQPIQDRAGEALPFELAPFAVPLAVAVQDFDDHLLAHPCRLAIYDVDNLAACRPVIARIGSRLLPRLVEKR